MVVDKAMAHQLDSADPELDKRVAAVLTRDVAGGLSDSERYLLAELRRANQELELQVRQRTRILNDQKYKLEAALREKSALIEKMSAELASLRPTN